MDRLITIPFSHFCEKARWALDWCGVPYREEGHLPMLHWLATRRAGGGRTVPVLVTAGGVLADSTDILAYADRAAPPARRLYPDGALALEEQLDQDLGPHTRRIAYHFALRRMELLPRIAGGRVAGWQLAAMRLARPAAVAAMRRGMRIDDGGAERSRRKLREVVAALDDRLADGRPYLTGDRFSAADLTLAALFAPLLFPPQHPVRLPSDGWPAWLTDLRDELIATRTGAHALRMYADHRAT
jgi:glutathione S-transferase